jgi:peptidoglycan-N-acetylglucosamine deacetylase
MSRFAWLIPTQSTLFKAVLICVALSMSMAALADGPAVIAKADQHLWPEAINTADGFDKASRASLLIYISALHDMQKLSDAEMLALFKIKSINRLSVEKWLKKERALSLENYRLSVKNCASIDWTCLSGVVTYEALLKKTDKDKLHTPENLLAWQENLKKFSRSYLAEQLRLAALFPRITSEIDTFNNHEWTGDSLPDRRFYLSFDDGPTGANGNTDNTLKMLDEQKKTAVFFVLGENLQNRIHASSSVKVSSLYQGQCIASHGWQHQSHAKWEQWQSSIQRTQTLLKTTFASDDVLPLFRPPYGQRKADSGNFFHAQSLNVALWNLDSQDWNQQVNLNDITNRMLTLMLIKRHGILLFHDVHPKAQAALPIMFGALGNSVEWGSCRELKQI